MRLRHDVIRQQVLDRDQIIKELKSELEIFAQAFVQTEKELEEERVRTAHTGDCRSCTRLDRDGVVKNLYDMEAEKSKLLEEIASLKQPWYKKIFKR